MAKGGLASPYPRVAGHEVAGVVEAVGEGVTLWTDDGGYADFVVSPWDALAATPDVLSDEDAAPLMCAGVTTFNGLRQSGARPGEAVAVLGLGGLGHLGVQFAAKMGFETIAIARGAEKGDFARDDRHGRGSAG
jgi:D-arabinose 1-dehydrogenase-like Zn-dependent alcohol dehydrogenase